jgi:CHAD domain-containing protein
MKLVATEREAKLLAGKSFKMPHFGHLPDGAVAVASPVTMLDAFYYDTADLELARWGITLRHRGGGREAPWTLKLPGGRVGQVLTRAELSFDGGPAKIPDEARDLVRGFTRQKPLQIVAHLQTARAPLSVRDANGNKMLEIVDDTVTVLDDQAHSQFHEIEIEIEIETTTKNGSDRAALESAVSTLLAAGCRATRPLPKVIRALGPRAQEAPSVCITKIDRHASLADLIRHLTASSAVQLLTHDPGVRLARDSEAVHQYRVATRRLRSDLRTFARFLDDDATRQLREELRWLGGAVGPVRDLDVLGARFATGVLQLAEVDQRTAADLQVKLATSRRLSQDALLERLRSPRYDRTLEALIDYAAQPPIAAHEDRDASRLAIRFARGLVRHRWRQLDAAVTHVPGCATDEEFHRIRILAKRCRYAAEAVAPVVGRPASEFAARVEGIQALLGDYHDTVVAEAWLRDAAVELVDARVAIGGLIEIERQERDRLRTAWPTVWRHASKRRARTWL